MQLSRINLCLLTYRRPELLKQALTSALRQKFHLCPDAVYSVTVIDNDANGSARPVFDEVVAQTGGNAKYIVEPEPGIFMARNRALDVSSDCDFIGFLDDDETAAESWMDLLLHTMRKYDADITAGPVIPHFENAPEWVIRGKFFAPYSVSTGLPPMYVESNNVLIKTSLALQFRFDPRLIAGEDTHYFMQLRQAGAKISWCAEAGVVEFVPVTRTTRKWLIERAYSNGARFTNACLLLFPGFRTIWTRWMKGLGMIATGSLLMPLALFRTDWKVKAQRLISRGRGTLSALIGVRHEYYKRSEERAI